EPTAASTPRQASGSSPRRSSGRSCARSPKARASQAPACSESKPRLRPSSGKESRKDRRIGRRRRRLHYVRSPSMKRTPRRARLALASPPPFTSAPAQGSSHREAPFITTQPKVDGTDFYMFRSYEAGRSDYVTLVADYIPLQDPYGGPNYFAMDEDALYEIHVDNNGDAVEDVSFQFRFKDALADIALPIGGKRGSLPPIPAARGDAARGAAA